MFHPPHPPFQLVLSTNPAPPNHALASLPRAALATEPNRNITAGTTNMLSAVDEINPNTITIAIGA